MEKRQSRLLNWNEIIKHDREEKKGNRNKNQNTDSKYNCNRCVLFSIAYFPDKKIDRKIDPLGKLKSFSLSVCVEKYTRILLYEWLHKFFIYVFTIYAFVVV